MASSSPPVRPWADLQHDLLVMIMSRVGLPDLLSGGATRACSAWRASARDPLVWRRVDLRDWAILTSARRRLAAGDGEAAAAGRGRVPLQAALCSVLEIVVRRAAGRMEALLLPEFADEEHLLFLAQSARGWKRRIGTKSVLPIAAPSPSLQITTPSVAN
uniref:F-box domain-containing protein n=1 Tax=Oryza meridionalis TaxID=40149 RepID=A0A0E0D2T0_9ORYZ